MTMPTRISKRGGGGGGRGASENDYFCQNSMGMLLFVFLALLPFLKPVGKIIVPKVTKSFCAYVTSVSEKTTTQEYG